MRCQLSFQRLCGLAGAVHRPGSNSSRRIVAASFTVDCLPTRQSYLGIIEFSGYHGNGTAYELRERAIWCKMLLKDT